MAYHVNITTNASQDIQEAIDWENNRKPGLGQYMLQMVEERIEQVASSPGTGSIRYKNIRCTATRIFSYLVHYVVDEELETITIVRVLSTHRKPIW
jgi:plasmid stabilization system protein ParE